jgi:DNA-directed RNA polymerase specialized sigma24 family protein
MDDDELIASLAGGDDTALRPLFARHAPWLAARLRRALSPDDVEDVLQETFLAVWKNAKNYRPQGTPEAWLWVIARNQAALLLRMLATVLPPSSGTVRLLDRDPGGPAARTEIRRRLGYLPQNLGYYPSFTRSR